MGVGDGGLWSGDWGWGTGPNPPSPIPNPQSPIPIKIQNNLIPLNKLYNKLINK